MSAPLRRTSPAILAEATVSCMRLRIRMNVDLPQPDGPISAVTVASGMERQTRSSTFFVPNHADTFTASRLAWTPAPSANAVPLGGAAMATEDSPFAMVAVRVVRGSRGLPRASPPPRSQHDAMRPNRFFAGVIARYFTLEDTC